MKERTLERALEIKSQIKNTENILKYLRNNDRWEKEHLLKFVPELIDIVISKIVKLNEKFSELDE